MVGPALTGHDDDSSRAHMTTPISLHDWDGPTKAWPCHCCNRVNDKTMKRCKTCGRSAAYLPSMHLPLFGMIPKVLRREQAIFLLDQQRFEVNATDSENWTPAHLACTYGNIDLLEVLVDRGARLEAQTKRGWKPLHFAAQGGHLACVELLLGKKARVTTVTKDCLSTPLHVAADAGFVDICRRLLEEAVDPEARDVMDRTALHLAANKGHMEVVKALLVGGASADVVDHDHWSPRQSAEFGGFMEVARVLAKGPSVLHEAEGATQGASEALPPAPWHFDIFAQVRLGTLRQQKLDAISIAREGAYARYANIYKDHTAERYANAIEASRQEKGGLEAYRRRVIAASTDAERYRGYAETNTPRDDQRDEGEGGPGVGLRLADGSLPAEFDNRESSENSSSVQSTTARKAGGGRVDGGVPMGWLEDGTVSERFVVVGAGSERHQVSGRSGMMGDGDPRASRRKGGEAGGDGNGAFVDVVPFNNIRAKFLRPVNDTALSRPYHVAPLPDWRAGSAAGSRTPGSSFGSSTSSASSTSPVIENAGNGRTMEAYTLVKTREKGPSSHRRHSRVLKGWKEKRDWGAH